MATLEDRLSLPEDITFSGDAPPELATTPVIQAQVPPQVLRATQPKIPDDLDFGERTPAASPVAPQSTGITPQATSVETDADFKEAAQALKDANQQSQDTYAKITPTNLGESLKATVEDAGTRLKAFFHPDLSVPQDPNEIPKQMVALAAKGIDRATWAMGGSNIELPTEDEMRATLKDVPVEQQQKALADWKDLQARVDATPRRVIGDAISILGAPLMMPQRLLIGNAVRLARPELMQRVREENERNGMSDSTKFLNEIAPPLYLGSDVLQKPMEQWLKDKDPDGGLLSSIAPLAAAAASVGIDTLSDPLMWISFLGKSVGKAADAVVDGVKALDVTELSAPSGKKLFVDADGALHVFTEPTVDTSLAKGGKTTLMTVGAGKLKVTIPAEGLVEMGQKVLAKTEMSKLGQFVSSFGTQTSNDLFNVVRNQHYTELGAANLFADDIATAGSGALKGADLKDSVGKYAMMIRDVGQEGADRVAARTGLKLSAADKQQAVALGDEMAKWRAWSKDVYETSTGDKIPEFTTASPKQVMDRMKDPLVKKFAESIDPSLWPDMFSSKATLGRDVDPVALKQMRQASLAEGEADQFFRRDSTLKTMADSQKERDKLSTWAAEEINKAKYGIKDGNFYDYNIIRSTQNEVRDTLQVASNKRFADSAKTFGMNRQEWTDAIQKAKDYVNNPANPFDPEMYRRAQMNAGMMKPIDSDAFESFKRMTPIERKREELLFEPTVRQALNARLSPGVKNSVAASMDYINRVIAKGSLSSIHRIGPQTMEGITASLSAGVNPKNYWDTIMSRFKPDEDSALFKSTGLGQDLANSYDATKPSVITPKMVMDPAINGGWSEAMKHVWDMANEGRLEPTLAKQIKDGIAYGAKNIPKAVEYTAADWWLPRTTRDLVNGFQNVPKEAVFRNRLSQGDTIYEAADHVARTMLDFRVRANGVTQYVNPYIRYGNFFTKSIERLPFLLKNPWVLNMTDSKHGAIARAIHNVNDWDPTQLQFLQQAQGPLPSDPVWSCFMPGVKDALKHQDVTQCFLNNLIYGVIGKADKISPNSATDGILQKSKEGFQSLFQLPNYASAPRDFITRPFSERGIGGSLHPVIQAALTQLFGLNMATGEKLSLDKTEEAQLQKFQTMASYAKPVDNPNFWAAMDVVEKLMFEKHSEAINGIYDSDEFKTAMRYSFGRPAEAQSAIDKAKIPEKQLRSMIQFGTVGLLTISQPEVISHMAVRGMLAERKALTEEAHKDAVRGDEEGTRRNMAAVVHVNRRLGTFMDAKLAYDAATFGMRQNPEVGGHFEMLENQQLLPKMDDDPDEEPVDPANLPSKDGTASPPGDVQFNAQPTGRVPSSTMPMNNFGGGLEDMMAPMAIGGAAMSMKPPAEPIMDLKTIDDMMKKYGQDDEMRKLLEREKQKALEKQAVDKMKGKNK